MPHIELLVEEPSTETALEALLPKIVGPEVTWSIHSHQGKPDLLTRLPGRLRGYAAWLPEDWAIVVLVDQDSEACQRLKQRLEKAAADAGLVTRRSQRGADRIQVITRIAVEELEAWFFGDLEALRGAYPRLPANLAANRRYRNPDAIRGGTWEALERLLRHAGYHRGGYAKADAARRIAALMDPARNRSRSFGCFRDALSALFTAGPKGCAGGEAAPASGGHPT